MPAKDRRASRLRHALTRNAQRVTLNATLNASRALRPAKSVLANLPIQRLRRDAQRFGRLALVPLGLRQHGLDVATLQLLERELSTHDRAGGTRSRGEVERQILRANHAAAREQHGALDHI